MSDTTDVSVQCKAGYGPLSIHPTYRVKVSAEADPTATEVRNMYLLRKLKPFWFFDNKDLNFCSNRR